MDQVKLELKAGRGGKGAVSFRREKYVPNGGPDGGDGGRGGNLILVADPQLSTLSHFRDKRKFTAANGEAGAGSLKKGKDATDLILGVPCGTLVRRQDTGELLADLSHPQQQVVAARGGSGGRGNARFATPVKQAPRTSELGDLGEQLIVELELKLIADIGLVGLPNAGKSTLLAALTNAKPKIANYPFTTLTPNLGVAQLDDGTSVVVADVPGLIAGAHQGVGLGIGFLRHLERTRVLIHLVDAATGQATITKAIKEVHNELAAFSQALADKRTLLVFNKIDLVDAVSSFDDSQPVHYISAATGKGCQALLQAANKLVIQARQSQVSVASEPELQYRLYKYRSRSVKQAPVVSVEAVGIYRISSDSVERTVAMTNLENEVALRQLQRKLKSIGVDAALVLAGCVEGDTVKIGSFEFTFSDDAS